MNFSKEQYDIACSHFFNIRKEWKRKYNIEETSIIDNNDYIDANLKNILLEYFYIHDFCFPTIEQLIYFLWNINSHEVNIKPEDYNTILFIIKTYILIQGTIPSISTIPHIIFFYLNNNKTPTDKELLYLTIKFDYSFNIINYKLNENGLNDEEIGSCGICFEYFLHNQEIIKLDCGHTFHYKEMNCLGNCSILDWILVSCSKNLFATCPICRSKIAKL